MLPEILEGCLTEKQRNAGLELYEPDDYLLVLRHPKSREVVATYSSKKATVEEIRKDADEFLERIGNNQ